MEVFQIKPLGEQALLVEFEQRIAPGILAQVQALEQLLREHLPKRSFRLRSTSVSRLRSTSVFRLRSTSVSHLPKGIVEVVPAYASLAVFYDCSVWSFDKLSRAIRALACVLPEAVQHLPKGKTWEIPVCYEEEFALDLQQMAGEKGVKAECLVQWHTACEYLVYMLGFMPGFVYLGEPDRRLFWARRNKPRLRVPAGSIGIGGRQTGIYALEGPGGWGIIGRTPVSLFQRGEGRPPSPLQLRDSLRFVAISKGEYEQQRLLWQAGEHPLQKQWYG